MPDNRVTFGGGRGLPGFKPGQPPYMVGPDKKIAGYTCHVTLDGFDGKDTARKVRSFHVSVKGTNPQAGGKWVYNGSSNSYQFKEWFNFASIGVEGDAATSFKQQITRMASNAVRVFGGAGVTCGMGT
ncbi:MAG TPA: hypothetical protein PKD90_11020 [Phnomibacter sp.]|nr:hypothetical protein [Phnomibacter sp.]